MDAQDLCTSAHIGDAQSDLAIKASRATNGRIERVRLIGGTNENDLSTRGKSIHEREQLTDDAALYLAATFGAFRCKSIKLINKDDAGRTFLGLLEDATQPRFA